MKKKLLALITILIIAVLFAGCSRKAYQKDYGYSASGGSSTANSYGMPGNMDTVESKTMYSMIYNDYQSDGTYISAGGIKENPTSSASTYRPDEGLKIIYTASMNIQTIEWDKNYTAMLDLIAKYNGYIQNSSLSGGYSSTSGYYNTHSAYLSIRIPSSSYRDFLDAADEEISIITSLNEYTDDITAAYVDTEARIKTLKAQEERLLKLLEQAGGLSDLLEIEMKLGDVRYQIESYQSIMNTYKNLLSYSTIDINMNEVTTVVIQKDTFGTRVGAAFEGSYQSVLEFFDNLVIALIYLMPNIIIIVGVILIIRVATKKKRLQRKEQKRLEKEQARQIVQYQYMQAQNAYTQQPLQPAEPPVSTEQKQ